MIDWQYLMESTEGFKSEKIRAEAYRRVFAVDEGKKVLKDILARHCGVFVPVMPGEMSDWNNGRKAVGEAILGELREDKNDG